MWKCGKKFRATKKINILTLVLSEKKILNETKNNNPPSPLKLNGRCRSIYDYYRVDTCNLMLA